jgi:tetratricopeptide (TPR) repeat protein
VKASALVGLDRPEDAIAALSTALSANPDNPEYLRFRAAVRLDVGRPDEAIDDLAELEKRAPDSADVQHLWANAFVALGRSDAALERFGRAEELGGDPDVYIDHAVLLSELDRPDEAIALSRVGVERFPEDAELLALLGKLLADRGQPGDHRDAVDNLTRAFERQPRDPADVAESIGESLRQQGKSTEALAWLDRALAIQPDSAYGLGTKGQVLLAIGGDGAAEQALELFRRAVALSGDDPPGWLVGELVDALSDDGSTPALEEGLSHIDRYIGRGYHEAWILARRAETLRLLERAAEGLEAADAALAAAGTGDEATEGILGTKAHLLCDLGRPDEALEVADHLLELAAAEDRTNAFALSARIRALTTSDRHAEATLAIDRYLEIEEADPWALTMRASVLIEYGDFQGALDVLNAIAPGDPYRDGLIGYCSVRLGDPEPALAALERAVAGAPRLWWCWNEIGLILLERREREEAGKRFRVVLDGVTSSAGADPDLIANAAWSACLDEDPTTAVGLAQRSVALERDRCGNRLTLGTALLLADRKLAALDEFEAAETMAKGLRDPRRAAALLREAASDLELLVRLGRLDPAQPEVAEAIELLRSAAERLQPATTADV